MKLVVVLLSTFLFNLQAEQHVIEWKMCPKKKACIPWEDLKQNYLNKFKQTSIKRLRLYAKIPCDKKQLHMGVYLPQVYDAFSLKLNGRYLQHWNGLDLSSESNLIQVPTYLCKKKNYLELDVFNLNRTVIGLEGKTLYGDYGTLFWKSKINYLLKSGHSIISSYVMFFLSILTICFFFYRKHRRLLSLFQYSITSCVYLILSSGFFNFLKDYKNHISNLELVAFVLQSMSLIQLLRVFFSWPGKKDNLFISFISFHFCTIFLFLICLYYFPHLDDAREIIMLSSSFLIISPSIYALHLILGNKEKCTGQEYLFTWFFLFIQINDFLISLNIYSSIQLFKVFIPIGGVLMLIIHFKKLATFVNQKEFLSNVNEVQSGVLHDLKIPLDVIDTLYKNKERNDSELRLYNFSMNRIQNLISDILDKQKKPVLLNIVDISLHTIEEQIKLNDLSVNDVQINFPSKATVTTYDGCANRLMANVVKNAFDASNIASGQIKVSFTMTEEKNAYVLKIFNRGKIIQHENIDNAIDGGRSLNFVGHGIGLQQIYSSCKELGWEFSIFPDSDGTITKLTMKKDIK